MKAKINIKGVLEILRSGKYKPQACPFATSGGRKNLGCGDWCPKFGDPRAHIWDTHRNIATLVYLDLCNEQTLEFDEFTDERELPRTIDGHEAAAYLGVSRNTLYNQSLKGRIPCERVGCHYHYRVEDLDNYLKYRRRYRRPSGDGTTKGGNQPKRRAKKAISTFTFKGTGIIIKSKEDVDE